MSYSANLLGGAWTTSNVTSSNGVYTLGPSASMSQSLGNIQFILSPQHFKLNLDFSFVKSPTPLDRAANAYASVTLSYFNGERDVYSFPLVEGLSTPVVDALGTWYSMEWQAPLRNNDTLTTVSVVITTKNMPGSVNVRNLSFTRFMTDLEVHETDQHPHDLPLSIFVSQNGIKAVKGEDVQFWLKDTGDAYFKGEIEASSFTGGSINIGNGTFTVDENGTVTAADLVLTGGSITWGSGGINAPTPAQVGAETKIYRSASAPSDTTVLWLDTSATPNQLKRYDGSKWVRATPVSADEVGARSNTWLPTPADINAVVNSQTAVFNALTNNGSLQGLFMSAGDLYMNATYIKAGTLNVNNILLKGSLTWDAGGANGVVPPNASQVGALPTGTKATDIGGLSSTTRATDIGGLSSTTKATDIGGESTIYRGTSAPSDTTKLWLDTTTTPAVWKVYNGLSWIKATPTTAGEVAARDASWMPTAAQVGARPSSYVTSWAEMAATQAQVFNTLTNNGSMQGLFMQNGNLYVNASYIQAGTISAGYIQGGTLSGVTINVTTDMTIGNSLILNQTNVSGGIRWGSQAYAMSIYKDGNSMQLYTNGGTVNITGTGYVNNNRILTTADTVTAVFG